QGEEIGMKNPEFQEITDYVDVETQNAYKELQANGLPHEEIMEIIKEKSRDNSRTPMQWTAERNASFTTGEPWIKVAENYHEINVAKERKEGTIFNFYKKLIQLRKEMSVISEGNYRGILMEHPSVYGYVREYEGEQLLVLNHFYAESVIIEIPEEFLARSSSYLIGNGEKKALTAKLELGPYETIAFHFEADEKKEY
ncbi:MAG: alpha-glucosidase C-terminal domain-containing protein, partial [Carnobacterium alterfunditum]